MDTKQNRKVRYTKKVLVEALVSLMRERSISEISIKELCAQADINRSTFYAHYKDQYGVLREIEDAALERLDEIQRKHLLLPRKTRLLQTVEEALGIIADNKDWLQTLLSEHGDINFQRKLFSFIQQKELMNFKRIEAGTGPLDEISKKYSITYVLNGSIALVQDWIKDGMPTPKEKIALLVLKLNRQD
jgi:AcrR family transcriptional regulator